jgi:nucleoside recognition membrane protein YjiH
MRLDDAFRLLTPEQAIHAFWAIVAFAMIFWPYVK